MSPRICVFSFASTPFSVTIVASHRWRAVLVAPIRLWPVLVIAVLAVGCTAKDPYGRLPLSGSVTLAGTPLDRGMIQFYPADPNEKSPLTGALVQEGKYQVPREQGLAPGTYRVVISAPEAKVPTNPTGPPDMKAAPVARERIPA